MTDEDQTGSDGDGTKLTRRTTLKSLSGVAVGGLTLPNMVRTGAASAETAPHSWDDTGKYETRYPAGTTHLVCSSLKLTNTHHVSGDGDSEEHWVHTFEASSQVSAVETDTGDPLDNLRIHGIRIKNNNTNKMSINPSVASDSDAIAPDPNNPDNPDGFAGAILTATTLATLLAKKTPLALFLTGADLSIAFGVVAYDILTPENYKEYIWEGGYGNGIAKGSHQVTFEASSYYKSKASNPPIQISAHASQAYAGWDIQFNENEVSVSSNDTTEGPMGDPREMTDAEKEKFGIKKVPRPELPHQDGKVQSQDADDEMVYVAENPPISVSPISEEDAKELWD